MNWDIDRLHRKPPGSRLLVYLDQSARSRLAEGRFPGLLSVLRRGCQAGALLCPESIEHSNETVLIPPKYYEAFVDLGDELSMGVHFQDREEIWRNEVICAAAAFCGASRPMETFHEAFSTDPHLSIDELAPHGIRISVTSRQTDWHREEAQAPKDLAVDLQPFFDAAQARDRPFDSDCEEAFLTSIKLKLWPILDPSGFILWKAAAAVEAQRELVAGADVGRAGSAFSRFVYRERIGEFSDYLVKRFACLRDRRADFLSSTELRHCPLPAYEALLMTALLAVPGRKAKPGDLYDLRHLALGLSRCDIVTADGGMKEICRSRALVPSNVELFSSRELDALADHIEKRLTG